jgi:hypothetical protein
MFVSVICWPDADGITRLRRCAELVVSCHPNPSPLLWLNVAAISGFQNHGPVRLAYQPSASSTFLSQQTSNQPAVLFSQNKSAPAISHQPNEQAA